MEASGTQPANDPTTSVDPTAPEPTVPEKPHVDQPPATVDEVNALGREFAKYREEIAALREELRQSRVTGPTQGFTAAVQTEEERLKERLAAIADHEWYCHGCGALGKYPQKCVGTPTAPHPPLEMISTEELGGDPAEHTAAPDSAPAGTVPVAA